MLTEGDSVNLPVLVNVAGSTLTLPNVIPDVLYLLFNHNFFAETEFRTPCGFICLLASYTASNGGSEVVTAVAGYLSKEGNWSATWS